MKRHNEEDTRGLCEAWKTSGLSQKVFSKNHGIRPSTFYYWLRKLDNSFVPSHGKGFQSIAIDSSLPSAIAVIRYPSGVSVEWHGSADTIHLLKSLL